MKNVLQELIEVIKTKNSWDKDELLFILLDLMTKYFKGESNPTLLEQVFIARDGAVCCSQEQKDVYEQKIRKIQPLGD